MKPKYLIFLDIDGTLLQPDYTPNSGRVPALIRKLSRKGYLFCLNSNRALEDLLPVAKQFGINGPVIAENGIYFLWRKKRFFLIPPKLLRSKIKRALKKLVHQKGGYFSAEDTTRYEWKEISHIPLAWIANGFRRYTASIHVRVFGKRSPSAARALARYLAKEFSPDFSIRVSPIFANVLISPKGIEKGSAIQQLKKKFFAGVPFAMIGDDGADIPAAKIAHAFYAVGNATPAVKKISDFTARKTYTQGVVEILEYIDKNSVGIWE